MLRLLKIIRYSPALTTFSHVIVTERRALIGTLLLLLCVMCFSAEAMHLVEGSIRPKLFATLPDAMWWAIATLTTVGYGDAVPVTAIGKIVAAITMIMGLGLFALPVGIVVTSFVDQIHRRDFVVTWSMLSRLPLFAELGVDAMGDVLSALRSQAVGAGAQIAAAGDNPEGMYFILTGEAEAEHAEGSMRLGPGDFFGQAELLHGPAAPNDGTGAPPFAIAGARGRGLPRAARQTPGAQAPDSIRSTSLELVSISASPSSDSRRPCRGSLRSSATSRWGR